MKSIERFFTPFSDPTSRILVCKGSVLLFFALAVLFSSCILKKDEQSGVVARAFDHYLTNEQIKEIIPRGVSKEDSLKLAESFVYNWLKDKVVLEQAALNISAEQANFEEQLEAYRNSLLTFTYEKELVHQKLDTQVTAAELEHYYESHQNDFILKDFVIRMNYLKLDSAAPYIKKVRQWLSSGDEKSDSLLNAYCRQYASQYHLLDSTWFYGEDVVKFIPMENKSALVENGESAQLFSRDGQQYYLKILERKDMGTLTPKALVEEEIKTIILNKRKMELIHSMRQDLLEEAIKKKDVEIYEQKN